MDENSAAMSTQSRVAQILLPLLTMRMNVSSQRQERGETRTVVHSAYEKELSYGDGQAGKDSS